MSSSASRSERSLDNHLRTLLAGEFHDVVLVAFAKEWRLHRAVLARSPYFRTLFDGTWKESTQQQVELDCDGTGLTENGLRRCLLYLYTESFSENSESSELYYEEPWGWLDEVAETLVALQFFALDAGIAAVSEALGCNWNLCCKDIGHVSSLAALHRQSLPWLWQWVLRFLEAHVGFVLEHLAEIHPDVMVDLVARPGLRVHREVSRYVLAERFLRATAPEALERPEPPSKRRKLGSEELRQRIFASFPDWTLTVEEVREIRALGQVPENLLLDWWQNQGCERLPMIRLGFEAQEIDFGSDGAIRAGPARALLHSELWQRHKALETELHETKGVLPGLDWIEFGVVETGNTGEGRLVCHVDLSRGSQAEPEFALDFPFQLRSGSSSSSPTSAIASEWCRTTTTSGRTCCGGKPRPSTTCATTALWPFRRMFTPVAFGAVDCQELDTNVSFGGLVARGCLDNPFLVIDIPRFAVTGHMLTGNVEFLAQLLTAYS